MFVRGEDCSRGTSARLSLAACSLYPYMIYFRLLSYPMRDKSNLRIDVSSEVVAIAVPSCEDQCVFFGIH